MQLTFNTSDGRKELPVLLVGTLSVTIPLHQMQGIAQYATELNGGRIGYDTFCHRVNREYDVIMPAAKDSATVLIQPLGYGDPITDERGRVTTTTHVNFLIYEATYSNADADVADQFHTHMINKLLDDQKFRIRITYVSGTVHELHTGVDEAGLELVIKMCDTHILTDNAVRTIEIGSARGLANYWVRGKRRIVYNNYRVGQSVTINIDDALRVLNAPIAE